MPEQLEFSCPNCGSILSAPADCAGAEGPCPACGATIIAPGPSLDLPGPPPDQDIEDDLEEDIPSPPLDPAQPVPEPLDPWDSPTPPPASGSPEPMAIPRSIARESPGPARRIAFLILIACLGGAAWLARNHQSAQPTSGPGIATTPAAREIPANDGKTEAPIPAPPIPVVATPPVEEITSFEPVIAAPRPPATVPEALPEAVPVSTPPPSPAPVALVVPPAPAETPPVPVLPSPGPAVARGFRDAADTFFRANTPEARLPLLFSTQWSPEQLAEQLVNGRLSRLPAMEYKTVVHVSPSGSSPRHFYLAVKTTEPGETPITRELLLHLAKQEDAGFRVNADALAFHLENPIPNFRANPTGDPLPAWVFIERGSFQGDADPGNRLCLNLRMGPLTPVVAQALIEADSPIVPAINPWVGWGAPPKPVFLELRHSQLDTLPILTPGQQITADWLPPPAR